MTNAELIKALRNCSDGFCSLCPYDDYELSTKECEAKLMLDAADALEAADKRIDVLQKLVDINTERCEALRKQLREAHENYEKHLNELTTKCNQLQAAVDNYEKRIAELEAQLPKEGEWMPVDDGMVYVKCSVCGDVMCCRGHYCPNCGARMKGANDEQIH